MAERNDVRRFSMSAMAAFIDQVSEPQAVATLQVGDGFSERVIYFAAGGVRLISVGERGAPDIPSYLLDAGKIDVETLHDVLERVRTTDSGLRQVLEEAKVLTGDEFDALSRRFIRDEIFDLVFWDDTYYKVYPTSPPQSIFSKDRSALTGKLHFVELGEDVNRWIVDWKRYRKWLISDESKLYITSRGRRVLKTSSGSEQTILNLCGEGPSLRQLRRRCDLELPALCALLARHVEDGAIKLVRGESKRNKNLEASIEALEAALDRVIDKELVQEKLAYLYGKSKQSNKASEQLMELAREALGRDDMEAAEGLWEKIVALKSPNAEALDLFVAAYAKRELNREIAKVAFQYASALTQGGYTGVGEEVAVVLRRARGGKLPALEFQANWLASQGRLREAGDTYLRVTKSYEDAGDFESAVQVAEKGVDYDPSNMELSRVLEDLRAKYADVLAERRDVAMVGGPKKAPSRRGQGLSSKVVVALVAVVVVASMHFAGVFESIADASKAETSRPTRAVALPGADDELLAGAGFVPKNGRKGLDVRDTFALNEADGSVSTPLGKIKIPGGNGAGAPGGGAGFGLTGGSPSGGGDGQAGAPGGLPFDPFESTSVPGASGDGDNPADGAAGRRPMTVDGSSGFADGASLPFVGRLPGSKPRTPTTAQRTVDWRSLPAGTSSESRGGKATTAPSPRGVVSADSLENASVVSQTVRRRHSRVVNGHLSVTYRTGDDLVLRKRTTEEEVLRLAGERGAHWMLDQGALTICRWSAGKPVRFYNRFGGQHVETKWKVPENTEALIASESYIAVRVGETTGVFRRDGTRVESATLPRWEEGVFVRESLVISPLGGRGFWVYHAVTLELQWSAVDDLR